MSRKLTTNSGWKENIINFLNENKKSWDDLTFWKKFLSKTLVHKSSIEAVLRITTANSLTLLLSGDLSEKDLERMFAAVPYSTLKWIKVARLVVLESRLVGPSIHEEPTTKESNRPSSSTIEIQAFSSEEKQPRITETSEQQQDAQDLIHKNQQVSGNESHKSPLEQELEEIDFSDYQRIRGEASVDDNIFLLNRRMSPEPLEN